MNKLLQATLGVSAAAVVVTASLTPAMVKAWGDSNNGRPSYTNAQVSNGALRNKIVFNSISDSKIGDEKNFVAAKVAGANVSTWNADTINVKDGETYTIRLYVHNNNPKGTDKIAEDVKATFSLPTTVDKSHTITGYLYASNADPTNYWDEVELKSNDYFFLEYVEGSAKYNNNKGTFSLPNTIITSGSLIGYEKMDGKIPGCYEYSGVVTIDVKVHSAPLALVEKTVRIKGDSDKTWKESVNAKVGDEIEFQIRYKNLIDETVKDVAIRDFLPDNIEFVNGSAVLYNASHQEEPFHLTDDHLVSNGVIIGNYGEGGDAYVRFTGKVVDKTMTCGTNRLTNWANATFSTSKVTNAVYKDDATVMVLKDWGNCKDTPVEPVPYDMPNTGPTTIVTGVVGAGSLVTALGYYIASRKKLM